MTLPIVTSKKAVEDKSRKHHNIMSYLLEARTLEPEKQPLLANGSETFVSRQRLRKHVPTTTDTHATIEVLLETVFSARSVQKGYKEDNWRTNNFSSIRQV
jgi:hypothetical protein